MKEPVNGEVVIAHSGFIILYTKILKNVFAVPNVSPASVLNALFIFIVSPLIVHVILGTLILSIQLSMIHGYEISVNTD